MVGVELGSGGVGGDTAGGPLEDAGEYLAPDAMMTNLAMRHSS